MIFPFDVYSKVRQTNKMSDSDKGKMIFLGVAIVNVIMFIVLSDFFTTKGVPLPLVAVLQLVIFLALSFQIYRYLIFREQDRSLEDSDTFATLYKVNAKDIEYDGEKVFELDNGSLLAVCQLKYGNNSEKQAMYSDLYIKKIINIIFNNSLQRQIIVMPEVFEDSEEASAMIKEANEIEDPKLKKTMLDLTSIAVTYSSTRESSYCIYILVRARSSFFSVELEHTIKLMKSIFNRFREHHAFREIQFLDRSQYHSFLTQYCRMNAIDISMSKLDNVDDVSLLRSLKPYRIVAEDGYSVKKPLLKLENLGVKIIK